MLLKVAAQSGKRITLEGQEKDVTTAGLARMNMILHDFPTANILTGNTLASPKFKDGENLRTYDIVVANPPFSDKTWTTGLTLGDSGGGDPFERFSWGVPPAKQGDYAYLLHIIRVMKSNGKGACILPHGVLFRGNAEAVIRAKLVRSGYLKGIIGLPANLFYGTGIPACILVLDKENAGARKGVFMIDASKGFMKDGNKNRLRSRDIHKIVDVFTNAEEHPGYSRLVSHDEIEKNDFNLNLPRYIDTQESEDIQDISGHLYGGIPTRDIDVLADYWKSDVDALLGAVDRLIAKKRDLKQAAMQQLLTGQTRLLGFQSANGRFMQTDAGPIPADWEASTVGREFDIQLGKMLDAEKNTGVPKRYLGNRAVQWDRIDTSELPLMAMSKSDLERFRLRKGDLLVCEGGEVGRAAVWDASIEECYFQKALHRLRPRRGFNSHLMVAVLQTMSERGLLLNYVTQTSIAHLPKDKFVTVPLPVPPHPEQTAIAEVLSDMDAEIAALEHRRAKTRDLKQGMMQELLTGKTRLH